MARKCMEVKTGGSRRAEGKDREQKSDGAKKSASKKSTKSKRKGGENGA